MIDRIQALQGEAESAIAAATSSEQLEELRVRYLGRKAELPQMLRGVAELEPAERGAVGKAANQARQALEALIAARAGAAVGRRARAAPAQRPRRRHAAGRAAAADRPPARAHLDPA